MSVIATVPYSFAAGEDKAGLPLSGVLLRLTYGDETTAGGPYPADAEKAPGNYIWHDKIEVPDDWSVGFFAINLGDGSGERFYAVDKTDLSLPPGIAISPGGVGSFAVPTVEQVLAWTGINPVILGSNDSDLATLLTTLITLAASRVSLEVSEERFYSDTLTNSQILILQHAISYHAAASFLVAPMVRKLTGTHRPLQVEDGSTIDEVAQEFRAEAVALSTLFAIGGDLSDRGNRMAYDAARRSR